MHTHGGASVCLRSFTQSIRSLFLCQLRMLKFRLPSQGSIRQYSTTNASSVLSFFPSLFLVDLLRFLRERPQEIQLYQCLQLPCCDSLHWKDKNQRNGRTTLGIPVTTALSNHFLQEKFCFLTAWMRKYGDTLNHSDLKRFNTLVVFKRAFVYITRVFMLSLPHCGIFPGSPVFSVFVPAPSRTQEALTHVYAWEFWCNLFFDSLNRRSVLYTVAKETSNPKVRKCWT